ncbi:ParB-like protein [Burkholderia perseverans]|uniref:ParB-like protein n=1 Tax=Burkholderia perseverans TaxID=2615214 RepID=UPI001FEF95C2|nr:ParB-like protein [Burkholderia perseverans]
MAPGRDVRLIPARLASLRPTPMTVGYREVKAKREHWKSLGKAARRDYDRLPPALTELSDDPYRSLAGELRTAGGYAKDATPFSEFLWADYLRTKILAATVRKHVSKALDAALVHARAPDARYLPGWVGVFEPRP